ncbi:unnamed protein product [Phytophthora fragariaefolia]|uniref:Unnamed protein product n=1 Tax=Phytophthora fragariaefolia TaxID=1490495 RepID=A0A9W6YA33_9STRA|nr:unnamed protein product [Phytophthora fragariaefolia]
MAPSQHLYFAWAITIIALLLAIGWTGVAGEAEATEVAEVDVDDDVGRNVVEIVEARGYFVETHKVTTADDYILTMYRLPKTYAESQSEAKAATNKPVVLLQHGLLDSSFTFVCNFRNQSLAFLLVDATTFGLATIAFSWEDMGKYDLPVEMNYVLNKTHSNMLSYVGHSEGTSQAFVGFSTDQKLAQKVSYFAALAPVAWTGQLTAKVFKTMAKVHLEKWFQAFGISEFSAKSTFIQDIIGGYACTLVEKLCNTAISIVAGPSVSTNTSWIPVYISQTPAVKEYSHLDLTWAYNANEKMYQDLLKQLKMYRGVGYSGDADVARLMDRASGSASTNLVADDDIESRTSFSFRQLD